MEVVLDVGDLVVLGVGVVWLVFVKVVVLSDGGVVVKEFLVDFV